MISAFEAYKYSFISVIKRSVGCLIIIANIFKISKFARIICKLI